MLWSVGGILGAIFTRLNSAIERSDSVESWWQVGETTVVETRLCGVGRENYDRSLDIALDSELANFFEETVSAFRKFDVAATLIGTTFNADLLSTYGDG